MGNISILSPATKKIRAVYTDPGRCEIHNVELTETVTAGLVLCWAAAGTMSLADGNDAALDEPQAVCLVGGLAGDVRPVLRRGTVAGFDVSGISVGVQVTLTDTPGVIEEAGSGENVGRVVAGPGAAAADRMIYFEFPIHLDGIG